MWRYIKAEHPHKPTWGWCRRWIWGPNQEVWGPGAKPGKGSGDGVPQKMEHSLKYTTWNLRPCENERHNLMPLMAFFLLQCTPARGYFRYVLTVVCKYHLRFLGPYSIITHRYRPSSMFIIPRRTELILLSWFIVCCECFFIYSAVGFSGEAPAGAGAFLKVHSLKFKALWKWKA